VFPPNYEFLFASFAFVLGASIGSFLNVCIYRMPLGLSVNEPKRSFCPSCKYQIPLHHNIPLVTWLVLRGRCANCGSRISFRYFGVEFLTGVLFLAVWLKVWAWGRPDWPAQDWILAFPYWIMMGLFIVATFIDFEHYIIPDEITIWGAVAGIALSFALPALQDQESHFAGVLWSLGGAALGYIVLWLVVELGKKAFGKKQFKPVAAMEFSWIRREVKGPDGKIESDADLVVGDVRWKELPPPPFWHGLGDLCRSLLVAFKLAKPKAQNQGESWLWSETFARETDQLTMKCPRVEVDGEEFTDVTLVFTHSKLTIGDRTWELEKVDEIKGVMENLHAPREAMGFGDVKFIACIGAFLGWKAVLFTIMAASTVGAVIGVATLAVGRREWSAKIPFGPYLALGALIWFFTGPELVRWYWVYTFSHVQ
jgi:leader peptidase (prepilin peptidase)/N-methyltransferase